MQTLQYHTPLNADDLRAHNIPEPWGYGVADRTRFSELDPVGHVNNTTYLQWFENFRVHYMPDYGLTYTGPDSPVLVLRKIGVEYLAEMNLREDYIVTGRTVAVRTTSIEMEYAVWVDGQCRTTADAVLVFLKRNGDGRYALTDAQRDVLMQRDNAIDTR